MSNYPNMSYCMNENTLAALRQIIKAMAEEGPEFIQDLSRSEKSAFKELVYAAEEFLTMSEEMECYDGDREWEKNNTVDNEEV